MKKAAAHAIGLILFFQSCEQNSSSVPTGRVDTIATHTLTLSSWITLYNNGTDFRYSSTVTWSVLTQEIRDHGMVRAYMKNNAMTAWQALPWSYAADGCSETFSFDVNTGLVNIVYDGYHLAHAPSALLNGPVTVLLIAIPPAVYAAHPDVNWNDYEDVMALLQRGAQP